MAENPTGVLPDFAYQWSLKLLTGHNTLVKRTPSGREQRKGYYPVDGYDIFGGDTLPLNQRDRAILRDFMKSKRGKLLSFYWFHTEHQNFYNYSLGTISTWNAVTNNSPVIIIPFKDFIPTLDDVPRLSTITVAGISRSFNVYSGTYAGATTTGTLTADSLGRNRIEILSSGNGAIVASFAAREMSVGRFDVDEAAQSFMQNAASIKSSFLIRIQEL
jgi:hypothetical protein